MRMSYFHTVDLHGHTTESARQLLDFTLKTLPPDARELEVIHGYRQGTALREMVRKYRHRRIERKILSMNQGSTVFVIKKV